MAFADKNWAEISVHKVVSEYLLGERDKFGLFHPPWLPLIDNPNLDDPVENHKRLRLLNIGRGMFMIELPPDTVLVGCSDE